MGIEDLFESELVAWLRVDHSAIPNASRALSTSAAAVPCLAGQAAHTKIPNVSLVIHAPPLDLVQDTTVAGIQSERIM